MYSRPTRPAVRRNQFPDTRDTHEIKIPENYSGNMFRNDSVFGVDNMNGNNEDIQNGKNYGDNSTSENEPTTVNSNPTDNSDIPQKIFDSEPHTTGSPYDGKEAHRITDSDQANGKPGNDNPPRSPLSAFLPPGIARLFPFGHGIGIEEMLIIGVILLILRSPESESTENTDILLLLALLLFCG